MATFFWLSTRPRPFLFSDSSFLFIWFRLRLVPPLPYYFVIVVVVVVVVVVVALRVAHALLGLWSEEQWIMWSHAGASATRSLSLHFKQLLDWPSILLLLLLLLLLLTLLLPPPPPPLLLLLVGCFFKKEIPIQTNGTPPGARKSLLSSQWIRQ